MRTRLAGIALVVFASSVFVPLVHSQSSAKILEKKFSFPWPVQWKSGSSITLLELAWGPANSPEMIRKGNETDVNSRQEAKFFPDRPYAIALRLRAEVGHPLGSGIVSIIAPNRLFLIKNVAGDVEFPMELTRLGFLPTGGANLSIHRSGVTEVWEFFPVSPRQKEFLFQVFLPRGAGRAVLSFTVLVRHNTLVLANVTPHTRPACPNFTKDFTGTIGANIGANLRLTKRGTRLFGTEQYARVGKTLWLEGAIDFLGEFRLQERYPRDHVTGIFRGRFSASCQIMSGYFSKPDGSRLLPFEFRRPSNIPQP